MTPEEEVAALRAGTAEQHERIATLHEQNALLVERVRELKARLARDSHNRGKPPPADGLKRQAPGTRSLRRASGKRTGGQVGHRGETLRLVSEPNVVEERRHHHGGTCRAGRGDDGQPRSTPSRWATSAMSPTTVGETNVLLG